MSRKPEPIFQAQFLGQPLNIQECLVEDGMTKYNAEAFVRDNGLRDCPPRTVQVIRAGLNALNALTLIRAQWQRGVSQ